MSKQRGRAVPPSPVPDLPPWSVRAIIAEAVHRVVVEVSSKTMYPDGSGGCAWYAAIGARVTATLTGHPYAPVAGSFRLQTSAEDGGWGYAMDADQPLIPDQEFHCLMVRHHLSGVVEIADLASRHWRTWARRLGAPWHAPDPPDFIWCLASEVPAHWPLSIDYRANADLTRRIIERFTTDPEFVATLDHLVEQALQIADAMARGVIEQQGGRRG